MNNKKKRVLEVQMSLIYIGKKYIRKNPFYFRMYADFAADNEIDNSSIGIKTTNLYKQSPVFNGYYIMSELNNVLKIGYCASPLGYDIKDWFVDEVL